MKIKEITKYQNLTDEQISSLLCRNEATAAIEVTLSELYHALKAKIPIRQITAGQHIFIIVFSNDQKTLDFYYSVPSSGTRKASIETQKVIEILKLSQNEAIIAFSWTARELSFGVFSKYSSDSEGAKGNTSDTLFRVDKTGNIVQQSSNMSNVHIYKDGKYWCEYITKGKGCYENCNRREYKNNGIGMVDYTDEEKINNLKKHAVSYFYKTDKQSIDEIKTNPKDRAIVRGTIPKPKSKAGKPRKYSIEDRKEV